MYFSLFHEAFLLPICYKHRENGKYMPFSLLDHADLWFDGSNLAFYVPHTTASPGEDMIKPQTPPPSEQSNTSPLFTDKQEMLFDFFDKFGGLSWSEKFQAASYSGFPYKMALLGSWGTVFFGWLYLAYIGLLHPAIVLLLVLMCSITLCWYFDAMVFVFPYVLAQIWAAIRTPYNRYLLQQHAWHAWW